MKNEKNEETSFEWFRFGLDFINPLTVGIYWCFWFHLYQMFLYGQLGRNGGILLGSLVLLGLFWIRAAKRNRKKEESEEDMAELKGKYLMSMLFFCGAVTIYYGSLIAAGVRGI